MSNVKLFGDKQTFAVEVAEANVKSRFYLRFWIKGKSIGHFKRSGSLKFSFKEFRRFIENKEEFYVDVFDNLLPNQIYQYFFDVKLLLSEQQSAREEYNHRTRFYLVFGEQFSTDDSSVILLYKQGYVIFIWPRKGGQEMNMFDVPYMYFYNIVKEYISFYKA